MKILVITPIKHINKLFEKLESLGEVIYVPDPSTINELVELCAEPDIVFTNPNKSKLYLGKEFLEQFPSVSCICTASTGTTHIDMNFASSKGVHVICIKNEIETLKKVTSTADLALTLTLVANRHIVPAVKDVEHGNWDYEKFIGRQFSELNVGVVGLGRLGTMYARYMRDLGANVSYFDPYVESSEHVSSNSLKEIFEHNHVVSLHIHATESNVQLIDSKLLRERRDGLILINTSRGEVVNETDILNELRQDASFVYATDVITNENQFLKDNELMALNTTLPNLIITPHIGGMSRAAQEIAYNKAADLLEAFIHKVN